MESVSHYRSAFQCLKTILNRIESADTFQSIIALASQRIISLMTHLNEDIRERSVPVLELFLHQTYSGSLLTNHALTILESLLQQLIKKSRSERQFLSTIGTTTTGSSSGHARLLDCIAQLVNIVFDRYANQQTTSMNSNAEQTNHQTLADHFLQNRSQPFRLM